MPLPAALAARLARRGIIESEVQNEPEPNIEEEVIAEDYDESGAALEHNNMHNKHCSKLVTQDPSMGVLGCPNKWNVFHECSDYCQQRWNWGRDPDPKLEVKRLRMLDKYPLPSIWAEVYDPGTGRYYYWNTESELVSWLPPGHPRAKVSVCAAAMRAQVKDTEVEESRMDDEMRKSDNSEGFSSGDDNDRRSISPENRSTIEAGRRRRRRRPRSSSRERDSYRARGEERERDRSRRGEEKRERRRRAADAEEDGLDPMDPAAYSDVPRGGWSSGLERDVKTGVDSTASGPLFQQRPYPSPGDVLRANAKRN